MDIRNHFNQYAGAITALPSPIAKNGDLPHSLLMEKQGRFEVYYAPFDFVMPTARIVLVGITPGKQQAAEAINTARAELQHGSANAEACERAKAVASFAGPTRSNLVAMLDHIGVNTCLGVSTTAELWASRTDLVHFTSALRYPVLKDGENFTGGGILSQEILRRQIDTYFGAECEALGRALFVPLGDSAAAACQRMVDHGKLGAKNVLTGLTHPSSSNAERISYFLRRKPAADLSVKTNASKIDAGRAEALSIIEEWAVA